ncbi:MAG TPA: cell division protein FtsL [Gammaproteobacteria bacterium]|nr:cell division protein FtsL [Gammaproteobacteria bacterium]
MRLIIFLSIVVFSNALAVVYVRQENRDVFREVVSREEQRDRLNSEWGQLQVEQATWARHDRVEMVAKRDLHMIVPSFADVMVVKLRERY